MFSNNDDNRKPIFVVYGCESCSRINAPTVQEQFLNKSFTNATYFTFKTNDLKVCSGQCLREERCASVNFEEHPGVCKLDQVVQQTVTPSPLHPVMGANYFSKADLDLGNLIVRPFLSLRHSIFEFFSRCDVAMKGYNCSTCLLKSSTVDVG